MIVGSGKGSPPSPSGKTPSGKTPSIGAMKMPSIREVRVMLVGVVTSPLTTAKHTVTMSPSIAVLLALVNATCGEDSVEYNCIVS